MKIVSRFAARCPGCGRVLPPATFGVKRNDTPWPCLECKGPICVWCYAEHTATEHPEMGAAARTAEPPA